MKNALEKQESHLASLVDLSKQDQLLQLSQTAFQRQTDLDVQKNDRDTSEQLKEMNKTLKKGLTEDNGKSLNSNVIQLFKEAKKQSKVLEKLSTERAGEVTSKSMGLEQFKTIGERIGDFKEGFKNFFTLKGFLNKTGLVDPNSGGIISTAVNRRSAKMQYVEDRMKVDPNYWRLAKGDTEEEKKATAKRTFEKQFDEQQKIRRDMRGNEKEISRLEESGFTAEQIKRTGLFDTRGELAAKMEKVDSRVRVAKATPDGGAKAVPADSFSDEAALENQRSQAQVVDLLSKIEENTRTGAAPTPEKKPEAGKGGLLGMFGGILESALGFLKTGLLTAIKFIFNPRNILKFVTKIFVPAMIIGSIVNGIVDAFKAFFNGGDFVDVLVAGLGGVLEFLTFGLLDADSLKAGIEWMGNAVDKYIVEPVKKFFSFMGDIFNKYITQPLMNIGNQMYGLLDEYVLTPLSNLFAPVATFFRKIKNQLLSFFEDFGIPEIGFTIPIINKKVSIGPFYPFRPDEDTTRVGGATSLKNTSIGEGETETYNRNTLATTKDKTTVLQEGESSNNGMANQFTQNIATFDPKTGKAYLSGDAGEGEISKRAFSQIKSNARKGTDSRAIAEVVKEDEAYQKLGFFDKIKVDTGFAKASELLEAKKPEVKSGTAVYDKSAQNAQASMDAQKPSAPVVVNAPTTVSNTSKQNIAMPAPVRNEDSGFNRYLAKSAMVI